MKTSFLSIIASSIMLFSMSAFADKVTITGEPIVVQEEAGVYVPSTTVTMDQDYYYFTVDGTKRVCYRDVQPTLTQLTAQPFSVRIGGETVTLQCYDYNTEYFVVQ